MNFRVLMVDDVEHNLKLLELMIKRMGNCEVIKFTNPMQGLV